MRRGQPPFYGWVIVAVSFWTVSVAGLSRLSYSIMLVPLERALEASRADVCLPFSIAMLVFSGSAITIGRLVDRFGPRLIMPLGAAILAGGLILSAQARTVFELLFAYGVVASLGAASLLTVPQSAILANWFVRRRALATGIVFSAFGVGGVIGIPLMQRFVDLVGWRSTYTLYGVFALIAIAPLTAWLQRGRPSDMGLVPDGETAPPDRRSPVARVHPVREHTIQSALRTSAFWFLAVSSFLWGARMMIVQIHQVAHVLHAGMDPMTAASSFAFANMLMSAGCILGGFSADRFLGHRLGFVAGAILEILGLVLLMTVNSGGDFPALGLYALLYGIGAGAEGPCFAAVGTDAFGGRNRASIIGFINVPFGLGGAFGPLLAGLMFDRLGNYLGSFLVACAAAAVSCVCVWLAGAWAERHGETAIHLEEKR